MKTKSTDNVFDAMVKNLMQPQSEGGGGLKEKDALAVAERALKKMKEGK